MNWETYKQETQEKTYTVHYVDENEKVIRNDYVGKILFARQSGPWYVMAVPEVVIENDFPYIFMSMKSSDYYDADGNPQDVEVTRIYRAFVTTVTENGHVLRTVHFVDAQGQVRAESSECTFEVSRFVTTDNRTKEVTYSNWILADPKAYAHLDVKEIEGHYVSDVPVVKKFDGKTLEEEFSIVYGTYERKVTEDTKNLFVTKTLTLRFVDQKGEPVRDDLVLDVFYIGSETMKTSTYMGKSESESKVNLSASLNTFLLSLNGYTFVRVDDTFEGVTFGETSDQGMTVDYAFTYEGKEVPELSDMEVSLVYDPIITTETEMGTITRTINDMDTEGKLLSDPVTVTFDVRRKVTTNQGTQEQTMSPWFLVDDTHYKDVEVLNLVGDWRKNGYWYTTYTEPVIPDFDGQTLNEEINIIYIKRDVTKYDEVVTIKVDKFSTTHFVNEEQVQIQEDRVDPLVFESHVHAGKRSTPFGTFESYQDDPKDWSVIEVDEYKDADDFPYLFVSSSRTDSFDANGLPQDVEVTRIYREKIVVQPELNVIVRTINYLDTQGKVLADPAEIIFEVTRTKTTNNSTGEVTYSDWVFVDGSNYKHIDVLDFTKDWETNGYWYRPVAVPEISDFNKSTLEETINVIYEYVEVEENFSYTFDTMEKPLTIRFVDENGNDLKDPVEMEMGYSRSILHKSKTSPDGEITSQRLGDWSASKKVNVNTAIEGYILVETQDANAISEDGSPQDATMVYAYKPKFETKTETKKIQKTVNYVDEFGHMLVAGSKKSYEFSRIVMKNNETEDVSYSAWQTEDASYFTIETLRVSGYTPFNVPKISETIDELNDVSFDVVYKEKTTLKSFFQNLFKGFFSRIFAR